jgi:rhodanese-related sulfurtransferase
MVRAVRRFAGGRVNCHTESTSNIDKGATGHMPTKDEREPFYRVDVAEAKDMVREPGVAIIDVREPGEFQSGHIPGATLIPVNSVFARKDELPKDKKIVFVCAVGQRSALAAELAAAAGLPAESLYTLDGGTDAWRKAGEPVE